MGIGMNTAQALGVHPETLWEKIGAPLLRVGTVEHMEQIALSVVRSGKLTDGELAFLVLAGAEHLFTCTPLKSDGDELKRE